MLEDSQTSRPPSPAETLRRAAALLREDAQAAASERDAHKRLWSTITDYADDNSDTNRSEVNVALVLIEDAIVAGSFPLREIAAWLDRAADAWTSPDLTRKGRIADLQTALAVAATYLGGNPDSHEWLGMGR